MLEIRLELELGLDFRLGLFLIRVNSSRKSNPNPGLISRIKFVYLGSTKYGVFTSIHVKLTFENNIPNEESISPTVAKHLISGSNLSLNVFSVVSKNGRNVTRCQS